MVAINGKNTLFSIVVPAYNSASFIRTCIDSILRQTCPDFELILVDDGSVDDTLDVCNTYADADSRIKVIHKENGGHTSARNEGLKCAVGEYILFVDSDDWLAEKTLDACRQAITQNAPDIVIFRMQNSNSETPFPVLLADGDYDVRELEKDPKNSFVISRDGDFTFPKSLSGKCFRRDAVYENQVGIPREILLGEDGAAFIGTLLKAQRICVIASNEEACYHCLVRPGSVSRSADAQAFEKTTVLLRYFESMLKKARIDYSSQYDRYVVSQLYTAVLLVIRSGGKPAQLSAGLHAATAYPAIANALKKAAFSRKGYKLILKKVIMRYRLWGIAKLLDR